MAFRARAPRGARSKSDGRGAFVRNSPHSGTPRRNGGRSLPTVANERRTRVLVVSDAKFRVTLRRADVEAVLDYAIALEAEEGCRIYIPKDCHVEGSAEAVEHPQFEIIIFKDTVAREADIDPEFPEL